MIITVGTDIIEVSRIKDALENNKFASNVFTEREIEYCESKKNQKYQHYAVRFSAKEAIFKAISKYLVDKYIISWKNVEILNDENGRPYANFIGVEKAFLPEIDVSKMKIDVSLSHIKEYAVANVMIMLDK